MDVKPPLFPNHIFVKPFFCVCGGGVGGIHGESKIQVKLLRWKKSVPGANMPYVRKDINEKNKRKSVVSKLRTCLTLSFTWNHNLRES